jgi:hypothetical protein
VVEAKYSTEFLFGTPVRGDWLWSAVMHEKTVYFREKVVKR